MKPGKQKVKFFPYFYNSESFLIKDLCQSKENTLCTDEIKLAPANVGLLHLCGSLECPPLPKMLIKNKIGSDLKFIIKYYTSSPQLSPKLIPT
jgi:hypothetical protein